MMRFVRAFTLALLACGGLTLACSEASESGADAGGGVETDAGVPDSGMFTARCTTPTGVACTDQQISQLSLFSNVSVGAIQHESQTDGVFIDQIDARAGGAAPTQSFVYARFTANGLERVEISDEQAFESLDWHIAFRRYLIRLNSGVGGPGCTQAARVPGNDFAGLTRVPDGITFRSEAYFTESCELVPDGSGLPGAAAVALGSYWTYAMCVQMSGNVFVVRLADGRDVKLRVLSYYAPDKQVTCDQTGTVPMPSGAAELRVEWAYLP